MMVGNINSYVIGSMMAFVIKKGVIYDTIKFLEQMLKTFEKQSKYIKIKELHKPKCYRSILHYLRLAGVIKKYSKYIWEVIDYNSLKETCLKLQECYDDYNERERILRRYDGGAIHNGMQGMMYEIGRHIAINEGCTTIEAITSILIAYYVDNYGKDDFIKEQLEKFNVIDSIAGLEGR